MAAQRLCSAVASSRPLRMWRIQCHWSNERAGFVQLVTSGSKWGKGTEATRTRRMLHCWMLQMWYIFKCTTSLLILLLSDGRVPPTTGKNDQKRWQLVTQFVFIDNYSPHRDSQRLVLSPWQSRTSRPNEIVNDKLPHRDIQRQVLMFSRQSVCRRPGRFHVKGTMLVEHTLKHCFVYVIFKHYIKTNISWA